jgi:hypothetical protein
VLALTFATPLAVAAPKVIATIQVGSSPFFVATSSLLNAANVTNFNDNTVDEWYGVAPTPEERGDAVAPST